MTGGSSQSKAPLLTLPAAALLASACLFTTPAWAAGQNSIAPLSFTQRTLPNGLRIFAMPDRGGTTVSVQVWYNVGGRNDPRGRSGFAHLFEHLMFKSTRNMTSEQMMRLTEDVGGELNASTDNDYTEFHEVAPANHLERLLWGEAERMGSLVVDRPTFVSERNVVEEELRGDAARPYDSLFRIDLPAASYQISPYARSPIGNIADLDAATLEDVRAFHAHYYRPDNAMLVVSGNFDKAQLDRWIDQYFGPLVTPSRAIPSVVATEPPRTTAGRVVLRAPNIPLPAVTLSWQLPTASDPDHAAVTVIDALLAGGESARLYRDLVYRDQLASEAGVSTDFRKGVGIFAIYALLASGKSMDTAEAALRAEVARLRDMPVTEQELTRVRNQLVTATLKSRETAEGRASALAKDVILEGDPNASDKRIAAIQALVPADVQRVARRLFGDERAVAITYLPAAPSALMEVAAIAPTVVTAPLAVPPDVPIVEAAGAATRIQPPKPGSAISPSLPSPVERRLDNGLRVITVERRALPIVTAYLVADRGSASDAPDRAGLAVLSSDLLTKGTANRSAAEIARAIETLGGSIDGAASRDGTTLALTVRSDDLFPAMQIYADVTLHPVFAQKEIDRARAQALDALAVAYSAPGSLAPMVVSRVVFGDGPYGKPADGTPRSLRAITRDDILELYRKSWRPDTMTLIMVGDITAARAEQLATTFFGSWRAPAGALPAPPANMTFPGPRTFVVDLPQAQQAAVMIARPTIARADSRYYSMLVANTALGGGFGARLNQAVRVQRGLAYGAGSGFSARLLPGPLSVAAQTKNPSVQQVVTLMTDEMRRMGTERVPVTELDARKASLIGEFGRSIETTDGLAGFFAELVTEGVPLSEINRYTAAILAVTPDQVLAVSKELIDPARASTIIVGDAKQFVPDLRKAVGPIDVVPASRLDLDSATLR